METLDILLKDAEEAIVKSYEYTTSELARILVNKVHPDMLKNFSINYHEILSPLEQLAHVSAQSNTVLLIKPWEKQLIPVIEKALNEDKTYTFNVRSDEAVVYATLPAMTQEARTRLTKEVDKIKEQGKVSLRNLRKKYKEQIKQMIKSEDIAQNGHAELQKLIDQYTKEIDGACKAKKARIMKV